MKKTIRIQQEQQLVSLLNNLEKTLEKAVISRSVINLGDQKRSYFIG